MFIILLFVCFALYIAFNQTLIQIQIYFNKVNLSVEDSAIVITNNIISDEDKMKIKEIMEKYLAETKVYIDPNLTINTFSRKIHVPSKKISIVVNEILNKNFHRFINEYRIKEALKLIENEDKINIEKIYSRVGFNSRSTFNRVFKEII